MAKKLIKEIRPYVKLYRDTNNGIAWIEDGSTGLGISVHPNLDKSGSVTGMKKLGYWDKSDRIVLSHGWKYNIDRFVCDKKNDLEMIVADECMCQVCRIAFDHAQKDVGDLRQRTKKGIETARLNGKIIGRPKGQHSVSEREVRAKRQMMKSVRSVGDDIKK